MSTFFTQLKATGIKRVSIEVLFKGEEVTVFVTPKSSSSSTDIQPIILRGTLDEVEKGFFESVGRPLKMTSEFFSNVDDFQKQLEETKNNSAMAKQIKDKEKSDKEEKAKKLEKGFKQLEAITGSEGYDAKKEKDKVLKAIDIILEIDPENKKAKDFKEDFIKQVTEVSLFDMDEMDELN